MILYLDTSSLVKLYWEELHSDQVREWVGMADAIATSQVAYPEAFSALARRLRGGDIDQQQFDGVRKAFVRDWESVMIVDVDERAAGQLAMDHVLRGFDAVHLAAAKGLQQATAEDVYFSAFDSRLTRAAIEEDLIVLQPDAAGGLVMEQEAPEYSV